MARPRRHYAGQPTLPIQLKMTLLPVAARIAPLVLLCAAVQLRAEPTKSLTTPAKPTPDLAAPQPDAPNPTQTPVTPELKLVAKFDTNGNGRLDPAERKAAQAYLAQHPPVAPTSTTGRPAPISAVADALEPVKPGRTVAPGQVDKFPSEELFGTKKIRTLFLTFGENDWENQLADFAGTDVEVPARLEVDGQTLDGVGVHFRPLAQGEISSAGYKRTLRLKLDYTEAGQQLSGRRQLELLASASDPTFLRTLLYYQACQEYIPVPSVGLVRVVINGEDWGIYTSREPFDAAFIQKKFGSADGAFWTAGPGANLAYLGDDPAAYRNRYRLESPENPAAWARLIQLCKTLHRAPDDEIGHDLAALIDVDSTVRFLALQNAFINQDGYGGLTGRYGLYLSGDGRFHFVPLDAERSFRLLQVAEYAKPDHQRDAASSSHRGGKKGEAAATGPTKDREAKDAALLRPYLHQGYPQQSGTNLAVLLSHSLINKADSDQDEKVTAEEWHSFAISWFVVMDEDSIGRLTRDQFISKVRLLVTPPSVIDGRTTQTFGKEDAAAEIGSDFLKVIDADHDGYVTRDEMTAAFDHLFVEWTAGTKPARLTQPLAEKGLTALLSKSVFMADQTFIATTKTTAIGEEDARGKGHGGKGGKHGGGGGGGSEGGDGTGANLGPIHLGLPKMGGHPDNSRTVVTYGEQLDPLDGAQDASKPLAEQLLSLPAWRTRYLNYLSQITDDSLLWSRLGPVAKEYHDAIAAEVREETHKPFSYERFVRELDQDPAHEGVSQTEDPSLKSFLATRRSYLLRNGADLDNN